jgi:hypothetical protein
MKSLLIGILVALGLGGGAYYYFNHNDTEPAATHLSVDTTSPDTTTDTSSQPPVATQPTRTTGTVATASTKDVCSYLTASDFASVGLSALHQINVDSTRHICQYQYGDVQGPISAFGFFPFHGSSADLDKAVQVYVDHGAKVVPGIGNKAVELDTVGSTFVNAMVIFFNSNTVSVQLAIPGADMAGASAKAQALAKIAAGKF